jgi:hypothetical protein
MTARYTSKKGHSIIYIANNKEWPRAILQNDTAY